ncbi:MAG: hypothetical protein WBA74_15530, partial [Cyclobacteriaceae bacterium]
MKSEQLLSSFLIPLSAGILLSVMVSWLAPFTESIYVDIGLMTAVFMFGIFLNSTLLKTKSTTVSLFFIAFAALMFFSGQAILYRLVTYFYWGWTVAFLY